MPRIRIAGASVIAAVAFAMSVNLAAAQTAASGQAGPPMKLLAGLAPPHPNTHAAKSHAAQAIRHVKAGHDKVAHRHSHQFAAKRHTHHHERSVAAAEETPPPTPALQPAETQPVATPAQSIPAAAALPANAWPAADPAPAADATAPAATVAAQPAAAAPATDDLPVKQLVVDGRSVQVTSPDQVNAMDLAATAKTDNAAATASAAANDTTPAPTVLAAAHHADVGSGSWIAQVLAALGGAVAAGAVAWFLIGSGPVRLYG